MILNKKILLKLKEPENNSISLDLCKELEIQQASLFRRVEKATKNFRTNSIVQEFLKKHFPNEEIFEPQKETV